MVKNWIILFTVLVCCTESAVFHYYISPDNITCNPDVASSAVYACYSLQQFCDNQEMLLGNGSIKLFFMSGVINCTITASNLEELELLPSNAKEIVEIECHKQANFVLTGIRDLKIAFLKFTACSLHYQSYTEGSINQMNVFHVVSCTFSKSYYEGAIIIHTGDKGGGANISVQNCTFSSNKAGVRCYYNAYYDREPQPTLLSISDSLFINNHDVYYYGASGILFVKYVYLKVQRSRFLSGKSDSSAVSAHESFVFIEDSIFENNIATWSGNLHCTNSDVTISNCSFENNFSFGNGGAIYIEDSNSNGNIFILKKSTFKNNSALGLGGAVFIESMITNLSDSVFQNNFANISGGAMYTKENKFFMNNISYIHNRAGMFGGAAVHIVEDYDDAYYDTWAFYAGLKAVGNEAEKGGGAFYMEGTILTVRDSRGNTDALFANNKASLEGGAIHALNTIIDVSEHAVVIVENNTAGNEGGGWYIDNTSIRINANSLIAFRHNVVTNTSGRGGAIFYNDEYACILQFNSHNMSKCFISGNSTIVNVMKFTGNTATKGSLLFGGLLDMCRIDQDLSGINFIKQISHYEDNSNAISSDPTRICLCSNDTGINCTTRKLKATKMRGGSIELALIVLDQDENPKEFPILARYEEQTVELEAGEKIKFTKEQCTIFSYHIFTIESSATLYLQPTGQYCKKSPLTNITVLLSLKECSNGFQLKFDRCICERRLRQYFGEDIACDINSESVSRKGPVWLRYNQEQELEISNNCPLDYCSLTSHTISLSSPDQQCANHRSGVLCGACGHNHSVALGGSKCLYCHSHYTFLWLTPVFAVAGVLLVALLLLCNMTVSSGSLNGLIFYANIISTSGVAGLHNCSLHPTLSLFVAWLNLDLGVHTCFYPGMDTYQKTWLQFAFPLYIWLLVGAIITASHYSSRAMRVFGRNNVAILATLFLLSYSKLLKTIITVFSFSRVHVSQGDGSGGGGGGGGAGGEGGGIEFQPQSLWTYDGNVSFLEKKHAALFVVSLLFLGLLFLPYTLLLTFGQCLRSAPLGRRWGRRLVRSTVFVSILDAYHAPYERRHRYWTGLMLLTRCGLFLAFATFQSDISVPANMFVTSLTMSAILLYKTLASKVYKRHFVNLLELCFLVNLGILSAILVYVKDSSPSLGGGVICKATSASVSISLLVFLLTTGICG